MDELKKNPFWIGSGVLLVAALGLYVWLVQTKLADEFRRKNQALTSSVNALQAFASRKVEEFPLQKRLDRYKAEAEAIAKERAELEKYYKELDEGAIEKFFPALETKLGTSGLPSKSDFDVEQDREFDAMAAEYSSLLPPDRTVFIKAKVDKIEQIKPAQKRFWIQHRFARACRAAGVQRIEEIAFVSDKPQPWGQLTTFKAVVHLGFADMARLLSAILREDLVWRVRKLEVAKAQIRLEKSGGASRYEPEVRDQTYFPGDYILFHFDDPEKAAAFESKPEALIPEPPVKATVILEVLDFDFAETPKAEGEPAGAGKAKEEDW